MTMNGSLRHPPVVLHVLEAIEGGTARHVVDVVRHVRGVRHEVALPPLRKGWVTDTAARHAMIEEGARVHLIEMRRRPMDLHNAAAVAALRRLIATLEPNIIHGHSSVGGALARVAALGSSVRTVYTPNGVATSPAAVRVERALGARTDRIVAVSPSEAALIGRLGIAPDDRVATITNGVDLVHSPQPELDLRSSLGVAPGTPLVGTVTRLVRQKAPELFVRAAAIVARTCPDAHFVLVGSGPLRARVEIEAELTGLRDRFHLVPVLPYAGLTMGQLDVFVLASRFEGCPYSPLEAMRAGTPVVLSDVVGNRDVIEPGVSGLLVPADDPTALASGVSAALTDQNLRSVLVSGARNRLRRRFDVRLMGMALGALYSDLAQKHEDPHRLARLLTAGFAPWRGESRT